MKGRTRIADRATERMFDTFVARVPTRKCRQLCDAGDAFSLGYVIAGMQIVSEWLQEWRRNVRPHIAYGCLLESSRAARDAGLSREEAIDAVLSKYAPEQPLTPGFRVH